MKVFLFAAFAAYTSLAATVNVKELGALGDGTKDDSAAFQKAFDTPARPLEVIIPQGNYRITKTLRVRSQTYVKAADNARVFVCGETQHRRGDFLLTNAEHEQGNEEIIIEGGIWDGNNQGRLNKKEPDIFKKDAWSGVTLNFRNVRRLKLLNMTLANSVTYNIRMCQLSDFEIKNIRFFSERIAYNQDGLHFNGYVRNGIVENIRATSKGQTNDDLIALNADDSMARLENFGMCCGPIEDITFRNLYAEDCHTAVRVLSVLFPIRNIRIENIETGCRCYFLNADGARYCRTPLFKDKDKPNGVGTLDNITLDGVKLWSTRKSTEPLCCIETNIGTNGVRILNAERILSKDAAPQRNFLRLRKTAPITINGSDATELSTTPASTILLPCKESSSRVE